MTTSPLIDFPALAAQFENRQDFVDKLVATVYRSHRETPGKIRAAIAERDFAAVAKLSHTLKGVGGYLVVRTLHQQATLVEDASRRQDAASFASGEELAALADQVMAVLAERIATTEATAPSPTPKHP